MSNENVDLIHTAYAAGLKAELEEVVGSADRVMVVVRIPGIDAYRARRTKDRNYAVLTVREGASSPCAIAVTERKRWRSRGSDKTAATGGNRMPDAGPPFPLPRNLVEAAEQDGREAWLATLPVTVAKLAQLWSLTVGPPFQPGGQTAWVAPVRDAASIDMVMKVVWRHPEAVHEADGLRAWAGRGAVRLYASEDLGDTVGLLLEACRPGTQLASRPEPEQDLIVSDLLRRLWIVPPLGHPFRSLQVMCDQWAVEFEKKVAGGRSSLDRGLAREGIGLFRSLPASADREVLLCTDLHAENVLAAEREPWLLIDPKPYVGDSTYDPLQHMLNCAERLRTGPRGLATRLADLLDLDRDRLVLWLFARCVQESPEWPALGDVAIQLAPR